MIKVKVITGDIFEFDKTDSNLDERKDSLTIINLYSKVDSQGKDCRTGYLPISVTIPKDKIVYMEVYE